MTKQPITCHNGDGTEFQLAPDQLWRASYLRKKGYGSPMTDGHTGPAHLLGKAPAKQGDVRTIYYRFSNKGNDSLETDMSLLTEEERQKESANPVKDLSDDATFQMEVREALTVLERTGNIKFVELKPATGIGGFFNGWWKEQKEDLQIGYANRIPAHKLKKIHADSIDSSIPEPNKLKKYDGNASYPDKNGRSQVAVIEQRSLNQLRYVIYHEIAVHSLGGMHVRHYANADEGVACDIGDSNDIPGTTVASYNVILPNGTYMDYLGPTDVKAIQAMYGESKRPDRYVAPGVPATTIVASAPSAQTPVPGHVMIDYTDDGQVILTSGAATHIKEENPGRKALLYDTAATQKFVAHKKAGKIPLLSVVPELMTVQLFDGKVDIFDSESSNQSILSGKERHFQYAYQGGNDAIFIRGPKNQLDVTLNTTLDPQAIKLNLKAANGTHIKIHEVPPYDPDYVTAYKGDVKLMLTQAQSDVEEIRQENGRTTIRFSSGDNMEIEYLSGLTLTVVNDKGQRLATKAGIQ